MKTIPKTWRSLLLPPERYEHVEVLLPDQTVMRGVWTGVQWWCDGRAVKPQAWRSAQSFFELKQSLHPA